MWGLIRNKFFLCIFSSILIFFVFFKYLIISFLSYKGIDGVEWSSSKLSFNEGKPTVALENLAFSKNAAQFNIKKCVLKSDNYGDFISSFFRFYAVDFNFSEMHFRKNDFRIHIKKIQGRLDHLKKNHYSSSSCQFNHVSFYKKIFINTVEKAYLNFTYDNQKVRYDLSVPEKFSSHADLTLVSENFPLRGKVMCRFKELPFFLKFLESFYPSMKIFKKVAQFLFSDSHEDVVFDLQEDGIYCGPFCLYNLHSYDFF